jgi:uncharacterized membrane protein YheB (UPF0754 family)
MKPSELDKTIEALRVSNRLEDAFIEILSSQRIKDRIGDLLEDLLDKDDTIKTIIHDLIAEGGLGDDIEDLKAEVFNSEDIEERFDRIETDLTNLKEEKLDK